MSAKTTKHFLSPQANDLFLRNKGPVAVGIGLIALDVVTTDRDGVKPRRWAGGTCGNVLAILAYLGWRSYPTAILGNDFAAELVLEDLKRFGVKIGFLKKSGRRRTPIIVEKIRTQGRGTPRHRFVWTCPKCGAWFPGYQPVPALEAKKIVGKMPKPSVFFFDRVSRGALELARASAERGAIVVFEPSGIRDERLFLEAVQLSDILKYSHERLGQFLESIRYKCPVLEIETMGGDGLRYRSRNGSKAVSAWKEMAAYPIRDVRDTAGAGDWCTAGVIHALGSKGRKVLREASAGQIKDALRLGQALAALNCRYEGARGPMYTLRKKELEAAVKRIQQGTPPVSLETEANDAGVGEVLKSICPNCE